MFVSILRRAPIQRSVSHLKLPSLADGRLWKKPVLCGRPPRQRPQTLEKYVVTHPGNWVTEGAEYPGLLTRREFLKSFTGTSTKPFPAGSGSTSRLISLESRMNQRTLGSVSKVDSLSGCGHTLTRLGGSATIDTVKSGHQQIDSKRAIKAFIARKEPDEEDRIPEGSLTGKQKRTYVFHGNFLDLRNARLRPDRQGSQPNFGL